MPFTQFHEFYPDLAEQETRSITLLRDGNLPDGTYGFVELYCDEPGCDCRRVMFNVIAAPGVFGGRQPRDLATLSYGWEEDAFYRDWASYPLTRADLREIRGPAVARLAPQSEFAELLLPHCRMLVSDRRYRERLIRHYHMVRRRVDGSNAAGAKLQSREPRDWRPDWMKRRRRLRVKR